MDFSIFFAVIGIYAAAIAAVVGAGWLLQPLFDTAPDSKDVSIILIEMLKFLLGIGLLVLIVKAAL
jgi:hypothetical protein